MRTDSTPGHSLETYGSPLARRIAGALNISNQLNTFRMIDLFPFDFILCFNI